MHRGPVRAHKHGACTHARSARRIIPLGAATGRDTNVNVSVNASGRPRLFVRLNVGEEHVT